MALVLILAAACFFLSVAIVRRAAPVGLEACVAWVAWTITSDLPLTCAAAICTLCLTAALFDVAAKSPSISLRASTIGIELVTASAVSAWLAFSLWKQTQNPLTLVIVTIGGALFGAGVILERREYSRPSSET